MTSVKRAPNIHKGQARMRSESERARDIQGLINETDAHDR